MCLQRDDRGVTAVEYALLIAGLATVFASAIYLFGPKLVKVFNDMASKL